MRRRIIIAIAAVAVIALVVLVYSSRKPSVNVAANSSATAMQQRALSPPGTADTQIAPVEGDASPTSREEERSSYLQAMMRELMKPIEFYGKVIDHEGRPVVDAKVIYGANNNPDPTGSGSRGETRTDSDGLFTVRTNGVSIYVEVAKEGYYRAEEVNGQRGSYGGFRNHDKLGNMDVPVPAKDAPAVFVLRKAGQAQALLISGRKIIRVARDGTPTEISLSTGQTAPIGKGDMRVEVWTNDSAANAKGRYAWRCRVSIPGGGLVERTGQFDFKAPTEGYTPSVELSQSEAAERWSPSMAKQFFVRLGDDRYARINFTIAAGGDHFIVLETFLNPDPGNQNLESETSH